MFALKNGDIFQRNSARQRIPCEGMSMKKGFAFAVFAEEGVIDFVGG